MTSREEEHCGSIMDRFTRNMLFMAEKHADAMLHMNDEQAGVFIKNILDSNDVVFGVWIDPVKGAGTVTIKGDDLFREAIVSGESVNLKIAAIFCTHEQAEQIEGMQKTTVGPVEQRRAVSFDAAKWNALVRYDAEISAAAGHLFAYGQEWVEQMGHDFFALQEDRKYLPSIISKLKDEAEELTSIIQRAKLAALRQRWAARFHILFDGNACDEKSLDVLRNAEINGYVLTVEDNRAIAATKNSGTSYLRSNFDIQRFGRTIYT